jgi:hypothetical protein
MTASVMADAQTPIRRPLRKAKPKVTRGAKLLCINDRDLRRPYRPRPPVRGHVYCVREVYTDGGRPGVLLLGIVGPIGPDGLEQGFYLSRFRWLHG